MRGEDSHSERPGMCEAIQRPRHYIAPSDHRRIIDMAPDFESDSVRPCSSRREIGSVMFAVWTELIVAGQTMITA